MIESKLTFFQLRISNFPFVLLRRGLYYAQELATRPHADRSGIDMSREPLFESGWTDSERKKRLEKLHGEFRSGNYIDERSLEEYREIVESVLLESTGSV